MTSIRRTGTRQLPASNTEATQPDTAKSQATPKSGATAQDSFETTPSQTSAAREIVQTAKAEGKLPMTENNVNRFIQNNLKPNQYPEAFRDVKGWVTKNFFLTNNQKSELNSLNKADTQRIQHAATEAARLNQPVSIRIVNPDKESAQPKQLVLGKIIGEQKIMSGGAGLNPSVSQLVEESGSTKVEDGSRITISEDKRKELQKQLEEKQKEAEELREKLKEEQEKGKKRLDVIFGDPALSRLKDHVDDSDKKLRLP